MRYGDAAAFRQALEQRLYTHAAGRGARLARDRKRIAFDRLLALSQARLEAPAAALVNKALPIEFVPDSKVEFVERATTGSRERGGHAP